MCAVSFWIGTYTNGNSSVGIYNTEDFETVVPVIKTPDPSWVTVSQNGSALYAVQETPGAEGALASFARQPNGSWQQTGRFGSGGAAPCHLCLAQKEQLLFCANYTTGSLGVFALNRDGSLAGRTALVQHTARTPLPAGGDADRQAEPHLHFAAIGPMPRLQTPTEADPGQRVLWTVDLGLDTIRLYTLSEKPRCLADYTLPAGFGPRHLVFHPTLPLAYVAGELSSLVAVIPTDRWLAEDRPLQLLHTLPTPGKRNYPSAIRLSPDGKKLYVANRGDDSISVFDIDGAGRLTLTGCHATDGCWPRDILLLPGKILIANQKKGGITALPLDNGGTVCGTAQPLPGPDAPVCLLQTCLP